MNKGINEQIVLRCKIDTNRIYSCTSQIISTSNSALCSNVAILSVGLREEKTYKGLTFILDFSLWLADMIRLKKRNTVLVHGAHLISIYLLLRRFLDMVFRVRKIKKQERQKISNAVYH